MILLIRSDATFGKIIGFIYECSPQTEGVIHPLHTICAITIEYSSSCVLEVSVVAAVLIVWSKDCLFSFCSVRYPVSYLVA